MESRTYVSFEWDKPDDAEFDENENLIAPSGRQILGHIRDELIQRGFQVTEVDQHEHYGWSFNVVSGLVSVWCMIQYAEPWLIITDVPLSFLHWLRGVSPQKNKRMSAP